MSHAHGPTPPRAPENVEPQELNHRLRNIVATMEASLQVLAEAPDDEVLVKYAISALSHQVSQLRDLAADFQQTLLTASGE